jgi:hypothetical protein
MVAAIAAPLLLELDDLRFGRQGRQRGGAAAERLAALRRGAGGEGGRHDGDEAEAEGTEADDPEAGGVTHDILP